jgi:tRNA nucleotidyltransferase/poly(A) polymerase
MGFVDGEWALMKKEPQIFTRTNVQGVPIDDFMLDAMEKDELAESLLRDYIKEATESESGPVRMPYDIPVPADLKNISDGFKAEGHELYIVGGAVRDALLNKTPKDYDLATGAPPEAVIDIVSRDPDSKVDLTGKSFGVVRVLTTDGNEYEIATFRKDIGSGRRPDAVEFTTIEDDVKRRDLTINALFYDMDAGEVVDYVGGIQDIKSGVVKAVGNPYERFQEDKLRILRAVRFAGRMGSDLDPETAAAIMEDNDLTEVSPERIRDELIKGLTSTRDVGHFLGLLDSLDLYPQIFPGLRVNPAAAAVKDVSAQLSLLLSDNDPEQVRSVLKGMKYTNDEVDAVAFMLKFPGITKEIAPAAKKEFIRLKMDPNQLQEFAGALGVTQKSIDAFLEFATAPPAVSPKDLMAQGLKGPEIGLAMRDAESEAYARMLIELRQYIRGLLIENVNAQVYMHGTTRQGLAQVQRCSCLQAGKKGRVHAYFDNPDEEAENKDDVATWFMGRGFPDPPVFIKFTTPIKPSRIRGIAVVWHLDELPIEILGVES